MASPQGWFKEVKVFGLFFLSILAAFYFFTNAQLVFVMFQDAFSRVEASNFEDFSQLMTHNAAMEEQHSQEERLQLEAKFAQIQQEVQQGTSISLTMQEFLAQKE